MRRSFGEEYPKCSARTAGKNFKTPVNLKKLKLRYKNDSFQTMEDSRTKGVRALCKEVVKDFRFYNVALLKERYKIYQSPKASVHFGFSMFVAFVIYLAMNFLHSNVTDDSFASEIQNFNPGNNDEFIHLCKGFISTLHPNKIK